MKLFVSTSAVKRPFRTKNTNSRVKREHLNQDTVGEAFEVESSATALEVNKMLNTPLTLAELMKMIKSPAFYEFYNGEFGSFVANPMKNVNNGEILAKIKSLLHKK